MSVLERVREQQHIQVRDVEPGFAELARVRERLKVDLVESLGLSAVAALASNDRIDAARAEIGIACQAVLNTGDYQDLSPEVRETLIRQVLDDVWGLGPLEPVREAAAVGRGVLSGCERGDY